MSDHERAWRMRYWIEVPKGTRYLVFGDLPHIIASTIWRHTMDDPDDLSYGFTRLNEEERLYRDVLDNRLVVRDEIGMELLLPIGMMLKRSVVFLSDLRAYLNPQGIGIRTKATRKKNVPASDDHGLTLVA